MEAIGLIKYERKEIVKIVKNAKEAFLDASYSHWRKTYRRKTIEKWQPILDQCKDDVIYIFNDKCVNDILPDEMKF